MRTTLLMILVCSAQVVWADSFFTTKTFSRYVTYLKETEGFRAKAYPDPSPKAKSVGYGTHLTLKFNRDGVKALAHDVEKVEKGLVPISKRDADFLLERYIKEVDQELKKGKFTRYSGLGSLEKVVALDIAYNAGSGVINRKSAMPFWDSLQRGDRLAAAKWVDKNLTGMVAVRRNKIKGILETGRVE